ncbi:MAG: hypothetical protein COW32_06615 [Candidatus Aquicultor secundus]|uniref:Uncharacterized protein n=1 Tax=Candidatus Aquicultor secundus TaxID=1973895 RepID=A0A2M7T699_9ACTN|nr:hypothetical protein [Candidatus Aquicultor secundus]NCO66560.1 hypothetical protein [Solirubrobacter sp.]OIO83430.1 MAG: hypothetical protein AUK32_10050 [Candidatus Aquicultor secundus]PIU27137.1 MAG: hypothetical protein COT10_05055 [Candidatus Aquicultor secundus]PIW22060.1 MAG: hypothetical protein COW32_06615 [Candidatus Aquicultor secundus]PIX51261.1 MAG: hypothetical protein COZ51_10590 [Candidatus Aquicultor secundus]
MFVSQIKVGAIFVGWITCLFLLFIMATAGIIALVATNADIATVPVQISSFATMSLNLIIFLAVFAAFFAGGYVSGRMAALAGALNGAMIVITTAITGFFLVMFMGIVGKNLGIDLMDPVSKTISSFSVFLFIATVFALGGSMLGGRFGEGYVDRLDLSLGITKPGAAKLGSGKQHQAAKPATAKPQPTALKQTKQSPKKPGSKQTKKAS